MEFTLPAGPQSLEGKTYTISRGPFTAEGVSFLDNCDTGDTALSGGFKLSVPSSNLQFLQSERFGSDSWEYGAGVAVDSGTLTFESKTVCFDNP